MQYLIACFLLTINIKSLKAQQIIPLYANGIPNSIMGKDEETTVTKDGIMIISKVSGPTLKLIIASNIIRHW